MMGLKRICIAISSLLILGCLTGCHAQFAGLLDPKGVVAFGQRKLFFDTLALMLIVVLPVIIMSLAFVYHYQVSHRIKDYKPNWGHNVYLESLWWGISCVIIVILAFMTFKKTHELDPYKPISGHPEKPLLIQAIALPWKWVFIYPEQQIATVNELAIPVNRQVEYWITADNVAMSAFFIPQLGSQIYAMAGMRTKLFLLANEPGSYRGVNTMFNGKGFSDMQFTVHALQPQALEAWFNTVKKSPRPLDKQAYFALLHPSFANKPQSFSGVEKNLFDQVIMTYMSSTGEKHPRQGLIPKDLPKDLPKG